MTKKWSILSLAASCAVCGFLVVEFTKPTSSLAVLISMIVLSVIGFVCSVIGVKSRRTGLSVAAVVLGSAAMASVFLLFFIMLIMGA